MTEGSPQVFLAKDETYGLRAKVLNDDDTFHGSFFCPLYFFARPFFHQR
jgi:hypothetical protein